MMENKETIEEMKLDTDSPPPPEYLKKFWLVYLCHKRPFLPNFSMIREGLKFIRISVVLKSTIHVELKMKFLKLMLMRWHVL